MARRLSAMVQDPAQMKKLVEKFVYIDADKSGTISLEELQEVHQMFDPERRSAWEPHREFRRRRLDARREDARSSRNSASSARVEGQRFTSSNFARYDAAKVAEDFGKMDADSNGKITMTEFLKSEGIDTTTFDEATLERARLEEIAAEEAALAQGVAAVEILPDGQEAQACAAAVEGEYVGAAAPAAAAAEVVVAAEGAVPCEAVAVEAVPM